MRTIMPFLAALGFAGCGLFSSREYDPLEVVPYVDVNRYAGKWYEIASLPVSQQKGCRCTTAEYSVLEEGVLRVVNSCMKEGKQDQATGKAFVVENSNNAKFRVQFFWPFRGDYWITDLGPNYEYAVVGVPSRKYCWILSRTPSMDADTVAMLKERLRARGFAVEQMQTTEQGCGEGGAQSR